MEWTTSNVQCRKQHLSPQHQPKDIEGLFLKNRLVRLFFGPKYSV
jgi:hypothetical protein